jgi:hypothetical protein
MGGYIRESGKLERHALAPAMDAIKLASALAIVSMEAAPGQALPV